MNINLLKDSEVTVPVILNELKNSNGIFEQAITEENDQQQFSNEQSFINEDLNS